MWLTTLKTCPIMKVVNTVILTVACMVKICRIELMSAVLNAHIIERMNPSIFIKGSQKSKIILPINRH